MSDNEMISAANSQYYDIVRSLVEGGANIHAVDKRGANLLQLAMYKPKINYGWVCWLLDHDVDFTVRYKDGDTLLHKAEKNKADMVIRELVRRGLDAKQLNIPKDMIRYIGKTDWESRKDDIWFILD
jgi:ankyrin repeat protein